MNYLKRILTIAPTAEPIRAESGRIYLMRRLLNSAISFLNPVISLLRFVSIASIFASRCHVIFIREWSSKKHFSKG